MTTGRTLTSFQDDYPGLVTYEVGSLVTIFSVVKQKEIILWEVQVSYYTTVQLFSCNDKFLFWIRWKDKPATYIQMLFIYIKSSAHLYKWWV